MGIYTGVWGTVKLKPDYIEPIKQAIALTSLAGQSEWLVVPFPEELTTDPRFVLLTKTPRNDWMFGGTSGFVFPDRSIREFRGKVEGNVWTLAFSVKNHEDILGKFFAILPILAEDWDIQYQNEYIGEVFKVAKGENNVTF